MSKSHATPKQQAPRSTGSSRQTSPSNGRGNAFAQDSLRARSADRSKGTGQTAPFQLLGQSFGNLQDINNWLEAQKATPGSTVPHEPVLRITVRPGKPIHSTKSTLWTYYSENQRLVIDGQGATVTGMVDGRPTSGWFLSYRPVVTSSQAAPAKANFEMRNLTVKGFQSGGVELSPQSGAGAEHANDGGLTAFLDGAVIENNRFEDLGSKRSRARDVNYQKGQFGAAGVLMRGMSNASIKNNVFDDLENGAVAGTQWGERLIHAVYARDNSSHNTIANNTFSDISGDAVRVSNGSNNNTIRGNTAKNAGVQTLLSEFYNSHPTRNEQDSVGNKVVGNTLGKAYGKNKKISRTHEKHIHKGVG